MIQYCSVGKDKLVRFAYFVGSNMGHQQVDGAIDETGWVQERGTARSLRGGDGIKCEYHTTTRVAGTREMRRGLGCKTSYKPMLC
jgi:hypothetical protein